MGLDYGVFVGGGGTGAGNNHALEVGLEADATVTLAPAALPVAAEVAIGGAAAPLAANLVVQGSGAPVAARVNAAIDPVEAGVAVDITQLPPFNIRIPSLPPVHITVPSEYTLGFSLFGFELFSFVFSSELKAHT